MLDTSGSEVYTDGPLRSGVQQSPSEDVRIIPYLGI